MSKRKKTREIFKPDLIGEIDRNLGWVFIVLIGILPLLVRVKIIDFTAPEIISHLVDSGLQTDIFSYYKWIFLLCMSVIALILMLYKILACSYEVRASYINIPVLLLMFFVVMSVITAEYKSIAIFGLYSQHEGALAYLAYFTLFFVAANTVFKEWLSKYLTLALGIFTGINTVIILLNFYGHNLIKYPVISSLLVPSSLREYVRGGLISTLCNPNYFAGLATALFVFFLTIALLKTGWPQRFLYIALATASFAMLLGALSSSGFASLIIVSPIIATVAFLSREKKQTLVTAGITMVLCVTVFYAMNAHNANVANQTIYCLRGSPKLTDEARELSVVLKSPVADKDIISGGEGVESEGGEPSAGGETIQAPVQDTFTLPSSAKSGLSGRIYIWKETLKLIKAQPLLGYGQDTLAYYFPQNDKNMIAGMGKYGNIISKPHNMYLGIAYGLGIPALLALLALFGLHIYHTGRHLWQTERNEKLILPAALFLFFCAFSVQWLVNDSVIGSSAILWTLLGMGVSLNNE